MIVQIYAATSVSDALKMVKLGVDQIGFVAGDYGEVHGELSFEQAREIVKTIAGKAAASALTMSTDIAEILRMATAVNPDIIHISSDTEAVDVAAMQQLRQSLPDHILLMKAINVTNTESINDALRFADVSDILLLDTKVDGMPGVGATGVIHDCNISRQIVEQVGDKARVVLAGGLVPNNVITAIEATHPWGVDSNTGTNLPNDPVTKDWAKIEAFVKQAKRMGNSE